MNKLTFSVASTLILHLLPSSIERRPPLEVMREDTTSKILVYICHEISVSTGHVLVDVRTDIPLDFTQTSLLELQYRFLPMRDVTSLRLLNCA